MKYKMLFYTDYYDGPLSGVINYEGKRAYFCMSSVGHWAVIDKYDDESEEEDELWHMCWMPRMYKVYTLPKISMFKIVIRHKLFVLWKRSSEILFNNYTNKWFALYYKLFKPTTVGIKDILYKVKAIGAFSDAEYK